MKGNAPQGESQAQYHKRRLQELKSIRSGWEPTWKDLAEYIAPSRYRLPLSQEGAISRAKIIDSAGSVSWRTLASGMHSGLTSPARPWFRLNVSADPDMREYAPVKVYLSEVERRMREVFQQSNIYPSFSAAYGDLGLFGQAPGILIEDDEKYLRMQRETHGRFWLARDEAGKVTTLYREFQWNVHKIVDRFSLDRVPRSVRGAYERGRYDELYTVYHAIEPRLKRNRNSLAKWDKPFLSNYWMDGADHPSDLLDEGGFDENPLTGPAWELSADDHYSDSPGALALGDVKMLQHEQMRKLEGLDKIVRPPMVGPTSMQGQPASLLPGSITYVDDPNGVGYRPAMQVDIRLAELSADIREVRERIDRAFFADLFLMLSNMQGIQPRNELELSQRNEEKLLQLGPVLENIYGGLLEPVIDRTFAILNRRGELPPPPPELVNQELRPEYISMLAQAQKAVSTGSIERVWGFAGQLAAMKPDVLDKLDADQAIDEYAEMVGTNPSIVVPDDKVQKIREGRAQQMAQERNAAMAAQMAPALKQSADAASVLASAQENEGGAALLSRLGLA